MGSIWGRIALDGGARQCSRAAGSISGRSSVAGRMVKRERKKGGPHMPRLMRRDPVVILISRSPATEAEEKERTRGEAPRRREEKEV